MKSLPILNMSDAKSIKLENRPSLEVHLKSLERVSMKLTENSTERSRFVSNPIKYLRENGIDVTSGNFVTESRPMQTAEVLAVNVGLYVNVVAGLNVAIALIAGYSAAVVYALGAVWTTGFVVTTSALVSGGGGGSCFTEGMEVQLQDGRKPIKFIREGDEVLSYNEKENKVEYNTVTKVYRATQPRYYVLNNSINVTATHPFFVGGSWKLVKDIKIGDTLYDTNLDPIVVKSIETIEEPVHVFNFTVNKAHTYFIEGLLAHNKEPTPGGDNAGMYLGSATTLV